jgi:hypothetical protein
VRNPWRNRDPSFGSWVLVGFLVVFGFVAMLSIGGPFLLAGVVRLGFLLRRERVWPECLGAIAGAGGVGLLIDGIGAVEAPAAWGAVGLALIAVSGTSFWLLSSRPALR